MRLIFLVFLSFLICTSSKMPSRDVLAYQIMGSFAKKMKNLDLYAVGSGIGEDKTVKKNRKLNFLEIIFETNKLLTIESGRRLAVESTTEFLKCINSSRGSDQAFIEFPMTSKYVCLIIIGGKTSEPHGMHIRSVHVSNGFIKYYSCDSSLPLFGRIHKETFEEGVRICQQQDSLD